MTNTSDGKDDSNTKVIKEDVLFSGNSRTSSTKGSRQPQSRQQSQGQSIQKEVNESDNNNNDNAGIWIGIDFGTSNCACAVWDSHGGRAKVLRLGHGLTKRILHGSKVGRIVPSAILLGRSSDSSLLHEKMSQPQQKDQEQKILRYWQHQEEQEQSFSHKKNTTWNMPEIIAAGYKAVEIQEKKSNTTTTTTTTSSASSEQLYTALITSVKRIVGMSTSPEQIQQLLQDSDFLQTLPFDVVMEDTNGNSNNGGILIQVKLTKHKNDEKDNKPQEGEEEEEEEEVCVVLLKPIQIVALLLHAIRMEAQYYIQTTGIPKKHLGIPIVGEGNNSIRNCVIGVPAHYGQQQRIFMKEACQLAGFTGHVSALTESTAAAMAYGLFISPSTPPSTTTNQLNHDNGGDSGGGNHRNESQTKNENQQKNILVFDMGGGTTDVTIASMSSSSKSSSLSSSTIPDEYHHQQQQQPIFQVAVTQGNSRLGGDDMDYALYQYIVDKQSRIENHHHDESDKTDDDDDDPIMRNNYHHHSQQQQVLLRTCKRIKEELCGTLHDPPASSVTIDLPSMVLEQQQQEENNNRKQKKTVIGQAKNKKTCCSISVSQEEFNQSIEILIHQAKELVLNAVKEFQSLSGQNKQQQQQGEEDVDNKDKAINYKMIHEVVLVGGATRVPAIREMLKLSFPHIQELCCSLSPEGAVAQGAAIQAAALSGVVPIHTLRSALMLDTVPHTIGVSIPSPTNNLESNSNKAAVSSFVPILPKDAPLPAKGYATFVCGDTRGVTVHAVEDVSYFSSSDHYDDREKQILQPIGEFTFMLHRLSPEQRKVLGDQPRTVDIGMALETNGQFIVSIFDSHDPEHIRKKRKYQKEKWLLQQQRQKDNQTNEEDQEEEVLQKLDYKGEKDGSENDETTMEQIGLMILCCLLFVVYLGVKVAFSEPGDSAQIL